MARWSSGFLSYIFETRSRMLLRSWKIVSSVCNGSITWWELCINSLPVYVKQQIARHLYTILANMQLVERRREIARLIFMSKFTSKNRANRNLSLKLDEAEGEKIQTRLSVYSFWGKTIATSLPWKERPVAPAISYTIYEVKFRFGNYDRSTCSLKSISVSLLVNSNSCETVECCRMVNGISEFSIPPR